MTETLADMGSSMKSAAQKFKDPASADQATIAQLVRAARARGDDLTGPNGLLRQLTATVLETALDGEMDEHIGSAHGDAELAALRRAALRRLHAGQGELDLGLDGGVSPPGFVGGSCPKGWGRAHESEEVSG